MAAIFARRGEFHHAEKLWSEQVALCTKYDFPSFPSGVAGQALAMLEREPGEEAVSRIRVISKSLPTAQSTMEQQFYLQCLVYACRKLGWATEGLAFVAKALELIEQTGTYMLTTDFYCLKGDLLLIENTGNEAEAERCFRVVIDVAQAQSAKTQEDVALSEILKSR